MSWANVDRFDVMAALSRYTVVLLCSGAGAVGLGVRTSLATRSGAGAVSARHGNVRRIGYRTARRPLVADRSPAFLQRLLDLLR
jgi:hypothetical protein